MVKLDGEGNLPGTSMEMMNDTNMLEVSQNQTIDHPKERLGLVDAYTSTLKSIELSLPCNFSPMLRLFQNLA